MYQIGLSHDHTAQHKHDTQMINLTENITRNIIAKVSIFNDPNIYLLPYNSAHILNSRMSGKNSLCLFIKRTCNFSKKIFLFNCKLTSYVRACTILRTNINFHIKNLCHSQVRS